MRTRAASVALILLTASYAHAAKDSCFECHSVMEGMSVPFKSDVHYKNGISCADCHGGDPNSDDQNISMSAARGFKVRVTHDAVPEFCARCHSDAAIMHRQNPQQRVDQLALYRTSVHSAKPAGSDAIAANCIDCHGVHNIRAVSDPQSAVAPGHLAATCGKCHEESASMFNKSAHAAVFTTKETSSCAVCHASHATDRASGEMLAGGRAVCARCHEPDTKGGKTAAAMERTLEQAMMSAFTSLGGRGGRGAGATGAESEPDERTMTVQTMNQIIAAVNQKMKKARSTVHSLDVPAVKAAAQATMPSEQ